MAWFRKRRTGPAFGAAAVYERDGALFVWTEDRTDRETAGFLVAAEHAAKVPLPADPEALGNLVRDALAASRDGVPVPDRDEVARRVAPLLRLARVRSITAFARGARLCEVSQEGDALLMTPTRNGGATGAGRGFHHEPERAVRVPGGAGPAAVGAAVLEALARSTADVP